MSGHCCGVRSAAQCWANSRRCFPLGIAGPDVRLNTTCGFIFRAWLSGAISPLPNPQSRRPPLPTSRESAIADSERLNQSSHPARNAQSLRGPKPSLRAKRGISLGLTRPTLLRLRNNAQVRLRRLPAARILLFSFFLRNRWKNDHVIAIFPIHRRGHFVLGGQLH
jgi:hypothetical protein